MCACVHLYKDGPIDEYHTLIWVKTLALNHSVSVETAAVAHERDVTRVLLLRQTGDMAARAHESRI